MRLLKLFFLVLSLSVVTGFSQDVPVDELPVATINESFYVTLPDGPVENYYYVDISHMVFADEQEAVYLLAGYVTGNLITNEVFYSDGYMILQIHHEYMPEGIELDFMQNYLNHLTKPVE